MVAFRNGDDLMPLLRCASEIEQGFEQDARWERHYEKEKLWPLLMELIMDPSRHAEMVQGLITMVKTSPDKMHPPGHGRDSDFKNKNDLEMMMGRGRAETLMRDIHSEVRNVFQASSAPLLIDPTDTGRFMGTIEALSKAETSMPIWSTGTREDRDDRPRARARSLLNRT